MVVMLMPPVFGIGRLSAPVGEPDLVGDRLSALGAACDHDDAVAFLDVRTARIAVQPIATRRVFVQKNGLLLTLDRPHHDLAIAHRPNGALDARMMATLVSQARGRSHEKECGCRGCSLHLGSPCL